MEVTIQDAVSQPGELVMTRVLVSNVSGLEVFSAEIHVVYDSSVALAESLAVEGTIANGFMLAWSQNPAEGDSLELVAALAGGEAMAGEGEILKIFFRGGELNDGEGQTILRLSCMFNEGEPCADPHSGTFWLGSQSGVGDGPLETGDAPHIWLGPSPATDRLWLGLNGEGPQMVRVGIYDLSGRRIFGAGPWQLSGTRRVLRLPLDLGGRAPGIYFATVETREGISIHRILLLGR